MIGLASKFHKTFSSAWGFAKNIRRSYPDTTLEKLIEKYKVDNCEKSTSLDLGCGSRPANPFGANQLYGVDIRSGLAGSVKQADLSRQNIPFENDSFDYVTAIDFIEHIPRFSEANGASRFPFIDLMNEVYRVLKVGGLFLHQTPAYPSKQAFQDPTHVNIITEDTFSRYFCIAEGSSQAPWASIYGFNGKFRLEAQGWIGGYAIASILRAED